MTWTFEADVPAWKRAGQAADGHRFLLADQLDAQRDLVWCARGVGVPRLRKARLSVALALPVGTRGDVDNRAKTVLDAIQRDGAIIDNDDQVDRLYVDRTDSGVIVPRITLRVIG